MDYKRELKEILRDNGKSGSDLAKDLGMSYSYYRSSTKKKGLLSRFWVRAFVIGYKLGLWNKE